MSRLVWTKATKGYLFYRRLRQNTIVPIFTRGYQSFAALPLPDIKPRERGITMPRVKWLERQHPCPDIEARIREVESTGGYHDVTKFERRSEK